MIDQMVADLKQQQQDDQEFRDRCVSELNENKRTTQETANNKQDTETEIAKLEAEIATLKSEIEQLAKDIAEARKNLKEASEDREVAHNEFKGILMNQRACIDTLKRATATLEKYYNTKKADQLIQARAEKATSMMEKESVMPAQPKGFDDMSRADSEKHLGTGNKILQLLREATTDAEKEMTTSKMDEANTQKNYETLVQELNTSIMDMTKTKTAKEETKADREKKLAQAEDRLEALVKDLATLENVRKEKTVHCRFIMQNFEKRQKGRSDEMEALAQAKSILRGSQSS
jgi:chromosome segregation ATPase